MLQEFITFIQEEKLFQKNQHVLVGVSGGIDSVVLCELFHQWKVSFAIAHCNFGLRGSESDGDDIFVSSLAEHYQVQHHRVFFDTKSEASSTGVSIQMAARNLRYDWFESVRKKNNYDWVAVGTHLNDNIETAIINLTRGTGLKGITGIAPKNKKVIRPLLFASRDQILSFATETGLSWREDSSNNDEKYSRNKIRHRVVPALKELNPSLNQTFLDNFKRFKEIELFLEYEFEKTAQRIVSIKENQLLINKTGLKELKFATLFLHYLLTSYGFNASQCEDLIDSLKGISGKRIVSSTHQLIIDRTVIYLAPLSEEQYAEYCLIERNQKHIDSPICLTFEQSTANSSSIIKDSTVACLDLDKLSFPLSVRKWKLGDKFMPLGMNGYKKLSDFFVDLKIPLHEKENIYVLTSKNEIVWVIGYRIDDRFKLDKQSNFLYLIKPKKINKE